MIRPVLIACALSVPAWLSGCSQGSSTPTSSPEAPAAAAAPDVAGKTWRVTRSTGVVPGQTYGFRADGTMVIVTPGSPPADARWERDGQNMTWVEEGQRYRVQVLRLSADELSVRVFSPGDPLDITMVPVDPPQLP